MLFEYIVAVVLIQRYYFCTTILLQKLLKNILLPYKANVIIYFTEFYTKIKCAQILKNTLHDHNYIIFKFTTVIKYISLCDLLLLHKSLVFNHFMNILSKFFAFLFLDPKLLCQAAHNPFY